jgi:hypothetical protein
MYFKVLEPCIKKKLLIILRSEFILYQNCVFDNSQERLHKVLKILMLAEAQ